MVCCNCPDIKSDELDVAVLQDPGDRAVLHHQLVSPEQVQRVVPAQPGRVTHLQAGARLPHGDKHRLSDAELNINILCGFGLSRDFDIITFDKTSSPLSCFKTI